MRLAHTVRARPAAAALVFGVTSLTLAGVSPREDIWTIRPITDGTQPSRTPAWSPDGQRIAFDADMDGRWQLHLLEVASGAATPLPIDGRPARFPAWSPDGRELAYVSGPAGATLEAWDLRARRARQVADLPGPASFPSWAPDGRTIAVTVRRSDDFRTWVVPVDGRAATPLVIVPGRDVWPRFSANGRRLAFFSRRPPHVDDDEAYVADVATSEVTRVTSRVGHDFCPAWHPSGSRLAVVSVMPDGTQAIRVIGLDGRELATPVVGFARATEPSWSPDGNRIVFAGAETEGAPYRLFIATAPQP